MSSQPELCSKHFEGCYITKNTKGKFNSFIFDLATFQLQFLSISVIFLTFFGAYSICFVFDQLKASRVKK